MTGLNIQNNNKIMKSCMNKNRKLKTQSNRLSSTIFQFTSNELNIIDLFQKICLSLSLSLSSPPSLSFSFVLFNLIFDAIRRQARKVVDVFVDVAILFTILFSIFFIFDISTRYAYTIPQNKSISYECMCI